MGAADCRLKDLAASPGGRRRGDLRSPGVMRAAVAAATGMPAPAGGWSSGMHPPISLLSCQKRNGLYPQGVCRIRKAAEPPTAARLHGPKRKALGAFRFATRCRGGRRSCCINPSLRPSSTTSQRQRKEKQFNATTTPTTSTSSAAGQQSGESQKTIACPKARQNRRLHRYADLRRARRATVPERAKRLFLFHRARRILFLGETKKRMGGASPIGMPIKERRGAVWPSTLSGTCTSP